MDSSTSYKTKYVKIPFRKIKQEGIFRWGQKWWQRDKCLKFWAYTVDALGKFDKDDFHCLSFVETEFVGVKIKALNS